MTTPLIDAYNYLSRKNFPNHVYISRKALSRMQEEFLRLHGMYTTHISDQFTMSTQHINVYGTTFKPIPFEDDPKFRELQAMAALVGAEITFLDGGDGIPTVAEYFIDGGGWRYWKPGGTGESQMFPIDISYEGLLR